MAKKSRKRVTQPNKDNEGCMSGLVSMFDFRRGHFTHKLLSDRKSGSGQICDTGYKTLDPQRRLEKKHEDIEDINAKGKRRVNSGKASIKVLMKEEMFTAHTSKKKHRAKVEQIRDDLGFGFNLEKDHKQMSKNCEEGLNQYTNNLKASSRSVSCQSAKPSEISLAGANLADLLVQLCNEDSQCQENHMESIGDSRHNLLNEPDPQISRKHSILQEALSVLTEALLTQKSIGTEQVTDNRLLHQSKEFMDSLETLNLNKELFLKLLQDPESLLLKHIQGFQNAHNSDFLHRNECEEPISCNLAHKQCEHKRNIFRKKEKLKGAKASNETNISQVLSRIVVLKPSTSRSQHHSNITSPISSPQANHNFEPHEETESLTSFFSLKEIKRRLRNMIGENRKEPNLITRDGVLHKVPYGCQNLANNGKATSNTQRSYKLSALLETDDNNTNSEEYQSKKKMNKTSVAHPYSHPYCKDSIFYEEARRHLYEMLNAGGGNEASPSRQVSKTLGRMLSLPEYSLLSPRRSPGGDNEIDSPRQMRYSPVWQLKQANSEVKNPSRQSRGSSPCNDSIPDEQTQVLDLSPILDHSQLQSGEDSILTGSSEIEECDHLDEPSELNTNEPGFTTERCEEEGFCLPTELEPSEEAQPVSPSVLVSPNSILAKNLEAPASNINSPDRPSPVSVLEPFFSEDNSSTGRTAINQVELRAEPRQLDFEEDDNSRTIVTPRVSGTNEGTEIEDSEAKLQYVKTILEASGLCCNQFPDKWISSDLLLDQFLFDEVEVSYGELLDDSKLIFDCVNEVLVEIQQRHLSCNPWVSSIKSNIRPIPIGDNFVQEVYKGVSRYLDLQFPCTMDQVVKKDLGAGTWMELQFETESAIAEVGQVILDYLMEETILELWE